MNTILEWLDKIGPWAICGLIVWGLGLSTFQVLMTFRMAEQERQTLAQWKSIDESTRARGALAVDIARIDQWKDDMEPLIRKASGL